MKLARFDEQTHIIAKDQPEYLPMPAHTAKDGRVTCCWNLSWRERLTLLLTGRIWHQVLTFRDPLQPQLLTVNKPNLQASKND